jgi:hypothetical protein
VGLKWEEAGKWEQEAPAASAGEGGPIVSIEIKPTLGEGEFAMILETETAAGHRKRSVRYAISNDSLRFDGPFAPLGGEASVGDLRVLLRGRRYWLVSFLRASVGGRRLFWGVIDWDRKPQAIEQIRDCGSLWRALSMVGFD